MGRPTSGQRFWRPWAARRPCVLIASGADGDTIAAYREAAARHNVTIAEVGVWNSPIADDEAARAKALAYAKGQLRLADQIGALCCVNVAGSTGPNWSFGCRKDRTPEGYERIVSSVREIIDDVQPQNTYYTIECMPIVPPTSPDEYLRLLADVGRDRFSVHLDPFNMIFTPDRYFWSAAFFHECFEKLGPQIQSVHAKSVLLSEELTFCIHEAPIMEGGVDFDAFFARGGPSCAGGARHYRAPQQFGRVPRGALVCARTRRRARRAGAVRRGWWVSMSRGGKNFAFSGFLCKAGMLV